ncbi:hypothetical protein K6Y31_20330 [Motilimonas cestriensis]|uniref:Flagellar motor switch protein FliN-like C-terminal domain-containing protein n=1 Tax=Motilimonas cestriensis TaxID=2742685 RepID=A0ABS8WIE2_9GAMM|nr:hypothetical protein [Motilimonas cestriensis]MCE2597125.1 hypothetical protein [Motilimonas cestriensis]
MDNSIILAKDLYSERIESIIDDALSSFFKADSFTVNVTRDKLFSIEKCAGEYFDGKVFFSHNSLFESKLIKELFGEVVQSSNEYQSLVFHSVNVFFSDIFLNIFSNVTVNDKSSNDFRFYHVNIIFDDGSTVDVELEHSLVESYLYPLLFSVDKLSSNSSYIHSLINNEVVGFSIGMSGVTIPLKKLLDLSVGSVIKTDRLLQHGVSILYSNETIISKALLSKNVDGFKVTIGSINGK